MCSLSNWISPVPMLNDMTGGKFSKLTPGLKYVDPATLVGTKLRESEDRNRARQQRTLVTPASTAMQTTQEKNWR